METYRIGALLARVGQGESKVVSACLEIYQRWKAEIGEFWERFPRKNGKRQRGRDRGSQKEVSGRAVGNESGRKGETAQWFPREIPQCGPGFLDENYGGKQRKLSWRTAMTSLSFLSPPFHVTQSRARSWAPLQSTTGNGWVLEGCSGNGTLIQKATNQTKNIPQQKKKKLTSTSRPSSDLAAAHNR